MGRDAIYPGSTLGIIGINRNGAALIATAKKAGFNVGVYVDRSQPSVTHFVLEVTSITQLWILPLGIQN